MRSLVGGLHAVHLCTSVSVFFFLLFFLLTQVYLKVRQASSLALETPDPQLIAACARGGCSMGTRLSYFKTGLDWCRRASLKGQAAAT